MGNIHIDFVAAKGQIDSRLGYLMQYVKGVFSTHKYK